jgi:cellulose synthase/poly-beta-1,6-N-acetylglucosamine synthase-like glycosyltransferase
VLSCDEKELILRKIDNLRNLDYPNYQVCFVDVSDDETPEMISRAIAGLGNFTLIHCNKRGRSFQLNEGLAMPNDCDYILVTDVDSRIQTDTLKVIAESFKDTAVGVVGGYVKPLTEYNLDNSFWNSHNAIKSIEAMYGYAPIVSGACYAFRKEIVDKIPDDVWADDIYIPLLAHLKGFDCVYSSFVAVEELRGPQCLKSFLKYKIRKSQDIIKELLRFLPSIFDMRLDWFLIYLTKIVQVVLSPFILISFLISLALCWNEVIWPITMVLLISYTLHRIVFKKHSHCVINIREVLRVFLLTEAVLLIAFVKYCFQRKKIYYIR